MGICFALLAEGTTFDVFAHELRKTRPLISGSDELAGFKIAWVAGRGVIMRTSNDVVVKGTRVRDVDMVLVSEEATINLPIGKVGTEGRGNGAIESLKGIVDKDIIS
jgi:hypothetical protein